MKSFNWLGCVTAVIALAGAAEAGTVSYTIPMDGAQEAPGPGDPDGFGTAFFTLDPDTNSIDWLFTAGNIALPLTGAHIHIGAPGAPGPVVINFSAMFSGSTTDADVSAVVANPSAYYVNLHNSSFPSGAIRGQLPEPATLTLLSLGGVLLARRRRA